MSGAMEPTDRRNRLRRSALQGVAVVAAGALLGTAGWWGAHWRTPKPAAMPLAVSTPTPMVTTPVSSPTPSEAMPSAEPLVTVPGLTPMPQATPDLIASTRPGWALLVFAPLHLSGSIDVPGTRLANALLLISPEGQRYHVIDLPAPLRLGRWTAGSHVADVLVYVNGDLDGAVTWQRLDLITGQFTVGPSNPMGSGHDVLGWSSGGRPVTIAITPSGSGQVQVHYRMVEFDASTSVLAKQTISQDAYGFMGARLDPTGSSLYIGSADHRSYSVIDLASGGRSEKTFGVGQPCYALSWLDRRYLLAVCGTPDSQGLGDLSFDAASRAGIYQIDALEGGPPKLVDQLVEGDPMPDPRVASLSVAADGGVWAEAYYLPAAGGGAPVLDDGYWKWSPAGGDPEKLVPGLAEGLFLPVRAPGEALYLEGSIPDGYGGDGPVEMPGYWLSRVEGGIVSVLIPDLGAMTVLDSSNLVVGQS